MLLKLRLTSMIRLATWSLTFTIVWAMVPSVGSGETTLERASRTGSITIGYGNVIYFGYTTPDGKPSGEAPEIAKYVLAQMGISEVRGKAIEFDALIPDLKAGRFDIIATGMPISRGRCAEISFSEPTYGVGQAFLVKAGNPKNLKTYNDVAFKSNAALGFLAGAAEEQYALISKVPAKRLLAVQDIAAALKALESGTIDAFAVNSLAAADIVKAHGVTMGLDQTEPFSTVAGRSVKLHGAFGFRKDDVDLREAFNKILADYIGSPEHLVTVGQFGLTKAALPEITTAILCSMPPPGWPVPDPPPPRRYHE